MTVGHHTFQCFNVNLSRQGGGNKTEESEHGGFHCECVGGVERLGNGDLLDCLLDFSCGSIGFIL